MDDGGKVEPLVEHIVKYSIGFDVVCTHAELEPVCGLSDICEPRLVNEADAVVEGGSVGVQVVGDELKITVEEIVIVNASQRVEMVGEAG